MTQPDIKWNIALNSMQIFMGIIAIGFAWYLAKKSGKL